MAREQPDTRLILAEMASDSAFNRAREAFHSKSAKIEQGCQQRSPLTSLEVRALEFEAVREIAAIFGIEVDYGRTEGASAEVDAPA